MPAVAGLRGTGDFGTDERPKSFREGILRIRPNGNAPIFALTSRAKKEKGVTDPQFFWWDETDTNVRLLVNGNVSDVGTTITVSSVDPTATTLDVLYGTATNLKDGDVLQVELATQVTSYASTELLLVLSAPNATTILVQRGFAGTTPLAGAASIPNGAFLTLIGSAYAEGTAAPKATSRNPVQFGNRTQIFKDTYELTGTANETEFRTGNPWSEDKTRKMFDQARAIEWSILFGKQSEAISALNGKPIRTMGGLREFIPASRTTIFAGATNVSVAGGTSLFLNAVFKAFDFETEAGDERIIMAGNGALNALNLGAMADANSDIWFEGPIDVYGMRLNEWIVPQGRLLVKSHPLMNQHPLYTNSMFVLDFSMLRYVYLRNRDTQVRDDVQTKDEDVRRGLIMTECSIRVDGGGLSMAYLGNVA
jgi:hypothetical protein